MPAGERPARDPCAVRARPVLRGGSILRDGMPPSAEHSTPGPRPRRRAILVTALVAALVVGACASSTSPRPSPGGSAPVAVPTPGGAPSPTPAASGDPGPSPTPTSTAGPTPVPTPALAVAPLTGRLVKPELAARHPIAVMVDDHWDARPQSGFTEASIVWQAPAEGGIPRYMMLFGEGNPKSVGPVRSARLYFVQWAAEWNAVYVHAGGSPQAKAILASQGTGQLVYNADEFRWGGHYLWRSTDRLAPHNVYTDGKNLRALSARVGAEPVDAQPKWKFADDAPLEQRPAGARIALSYQYGSFAYRYQRATNTWRRYLGGKLQRDRANNQVVAPKNVIIMVVRFSLLGAGNKGRLEAGSIGTGKAWIATNGTTIKGTWKKNSVAGPTRFYDASGKQVVLTRGQTFVQVVPSGTPLQFVKGKPVFDPARAAERGIL